MSDPMGDPIVLACPVGSGMGLRFDPWVGSWAETFAHLLIGHGSVRGRPGQTRPDCQVYR
jgi:hypothetical protein